MAGSSPVIRSKNKRPALAVGLFAFGAQLTGLLRTSGAKPPKRESHESDSNGHLPVANDESSDSQKRRYSVITRQKDCRTQKCPLFFAFFGADRGVHPPRTSARFCGFYPTSRIVVVCRPCKTRTPSTPCFVAFASKKQLSTVFSCSPRNHAPRPALAVGLLLLKPNLRSCSAQAERSPRSESRTKATRTVVCPRQMMSIPTH